MFETCRQGRSGFRAIEPAIRDASVGNPFSKSLRRAMPEQGVANAITDRAFNQSWWRRCSEPG
jgi:hypothetical protein